MILVGARCAWTRSCPSASVPPTSAAVSAALRSCSSPSSTRPRTKTAALHTPRRKVPLSRARR
eukprot:1908459-Rhodomonas_salina.3